jgi:P-type Ca2+ transporter type 2C
MVGKHNIHSIESFRRSGAEVLSDLKTQKRGLSPTEARDRLEEFGANELIAVNKESAFSKYFRQYKDLMILLLLISAGMSYALGDKQTTIILVLIVLLNTSLGFYQEHKAESIMASLEKLVVAKARVIRAGKRIEIPTRELVPGDIIYIEEGDSVPADARLIEESELSTNDFALTGESAPSRKFTHVIKGLVELPLRHNLVFMGTTVATGRGFAVVIGTGMRTELGRIASLSQETKADPSPLQKEMANVASTITKATVVLGGILTIITLRAGFSVKESLIFAIGIAAAMIPQGLPAEVNTALAQAANKLAKAKALVKKLSAVETLGATSIICTDKTGTLTKNEMTVLNYHLPGMTFNVTGNGYEPTGVFNLNGQDISALTNKRLKLALLTGAFASNARMSAPDAELNYWRVIGDPTEGALLVSAMKAGLDIDKLEADAPELKEHSFDSIRKRLSSVRSYEGQTAVYVKGAPETVLEVCTKIIDKSGKLRGMTRADKKEILALNDTLAGDAMRNLALAFRPIPPKTDITKIKSMTIEDMESDLIYVGLVSMIDPPRAEVFEAMVSAAKAHIPVSIITGDNAITARAVALKAGLAESAVDIKIISGSELRELSDTDIIKLLERGKVIFSRVAPEDKLKIVSLGKAAGHVVAVTGDGINDAPALKRADIGVAMGLTGTDVAKQSAEIVLLDDSFHTLIGAVKEGRIIFQNIKKATLTCLTSNTGELFTVLISLAMQAIYGIPIAIIAVQILAVDLVAELFPIAALGWDRGEGELMTDKPRSLHDHILNRASIIDLALSGILIGVLAYMNFMLTITNAGWAPKNIDKLNFPLYAKATTVAYLTIVFCQFINLMLRRTRHARDAFFSKYAWSNKVLLGAFAFSLSLVGLIAGTSIGHTYFKTATPAPRDIALALAAAFIYGLTRSSVVKIFRKGPITS